jgi:hypothetical protein
VVTVFHHHAGQGERHFAAAREMKREMGKIGSWNLYLTSDILKLTWQQENMER